MTTPYTSASGRVYQSFTKPGRSTGGGNCVEVGVASDGTIALRNSRYPTGPVIELEPDVFRQLLTDIKEEAFNFPQ
jgi:hypothetical protein